MIGPSDGRMTLAVTLVIVAGACAAGTASSPHTTTAAAPSESSSRLATGSSADTTRHGYSAADARFMQHMIMHHAQALAMVALVPARTSRDDIRLLAERIDVSQKTEIAMMQRWLRERGEPVADDGARGAIRGTNSPPMAGHDMASHDMPGHDMQTHDMPGMLTPAQMDSLSMASGAAFDRLFLLGMIQHHQGALTMVGELFASRGAGQEPEIFRFATDVDADQRAEIARMRALLGPTAADSLQR